MDLGQGAVAPALLPIAGSRDGPKAVVDEGMEGVHVVDGVEREEGGGIRVLHAPPELICVP